MKKIITLLLITSSMLVQAQNNINLPEGWSMFGFNCATPLDAGLAFSPISDKIVIVKDHLGNVYIPEVNFNGVGNFMPSTGYQIKMIETVEGFEFCEAVVPEDGITQGDVDAVQALLDAVVPEDGITQADVDSAVSAVQEDYIGWCLSDIDNDGICDIDEVAGCMDNTACNYDSSATDTGDCDYAVTNYDCADVCLNDIDSDGICDEDEVVGCMDSTACNYTPEAEFSDGSCTYAEANLDCDGNFYVEIGDLTLGGIIFYIDETGEHGLVASLEDLTEGSNMGLGGTPEGFEWGCYGTSVATASQNFAIGTGLENTEAIVSQNCQTINGGITAAQAALNYETEGYTDWFLPSKEELEEMYNTIGNGGSEGNIGSFETSDYPHYWSSSENNTTYAMYVYFNNGGTYSNYKYGSHRVRVVRAFGNEDEVVGCMDNTACNYDSSATETGDCDYAATNYDCYGYCLNDMDNDGICDEDEVVGCMDNTACNYDSSATATGNCDYAATNYDCYGSCLNDIDSDGICDEDEVVGCMNPTACNYTPEAEFSDASCIYAEANFDCDGNEFIYAIGDLVEGGIIFYIDETGVHGLVAALEDLGQFEWGCDGTSIATATQNYAIGTGLENTEAIVSANCQTANGGITAAQAALNYETEGYTDWFLPSENELVEMYNTIGNGGSEGNIGSFDTSVWPYYWSSSETNSNSARYIIFYDGSAGDGSKTYPFKVRVVRAFGNQNEVVGCMDATACNYNSVATENDASCTYADANLDCDGNELTYEIGDLVHGGIVFYIDETGEHGLVAALEDLTEGSNMGTGTNSTPEGFEWGCYGTNVATAHQNYAIGTGLENTEAIVSQNCQTDYGGITAAQAALNYETGGYTDWFLPSFYELEEMYNTIVIGGLEGNIGGFEIDSDDFPRYWSSSEDYLYSKAKQVKFSNGSTTNFPKNYSLRVRAVRAF
jgi:hypothetical protein